MGYIKKPKTNHNKYGNQCPAGDRREYCRNGTEWVCDCGIEFTFSAPDLYVEYDYPLKDRERWSLSSTLGDPDAGKKHMYDVEPVKIIEEKEVKN